MLAAWILEMFTYLVTFVAGYGLALLIRGFEEVNEMNENKIETAVFNAVNKE